MQIPLLILNEEIHSRSPRHSHLIPRLDLAPILNLVLLNLIQYQPQSKTFPDRHRASMLLVLDHAGIVPRKPKTFGAEGVLVVAAIEGEFMVGLVVGPAGEFWEPRVFQELPSWEGDVLGWKGF